MYYRVLPTLTPIEPEEIDLSTLTAGYIDVDELQGALDRFDFSDVTVEECTARREHYRNAIDVFGEYTFGLVNIVDVNAVFSESDRLAFFFRKNLFLVVNLFDSDGSTRESFMATLRRYRPETVTLEKLIFALLENGISHDGRELDIIEHDIALLEESVVHNPVDRSLNARLYEHKRRLMVLRSYYEQLIDIGEELEENENDIFEEESLHYFGLLTAKAQRLSSAVSMLCDELNQLREAHEAAMEYSLNNLMKVFTVITIIFLPLTLMTGWFGMNFTYMPSLDSPIGYPLFIVTCVAIVIVTLCFFKRKGYFK